MQALKRSCPRPLPKGWEIRCTDDFDVSGKVYWLDHNKRTTQLVPPTPSQDSDKLVLGGSSQGHRAETLPEYKAVLRSLVSKSERHERAKKEVRRQLGREQ